MKAPTNLSVGLGILPKAGLRVKLDLWDPRALEQPAGWSLTLVPWERLLVVGLVWLRSLQDKGVLGRVLWVLCKEHGTVT